MSKGYVLSSETNGVSITTKKVFDSRHDAMIFYFDNKEEVKKYHRDENEIKIFIKPSNV